MTLQDLKLSAYNGITPPEPLSCPERAFFLQAKEIYAQYHDKRITQAESAEAMRQAIQNYNRDMTERQNGIDALQRIGELYKTFEQSTTAFRKQHNEETALKVIECAEQILTALHGVTMRKEHENE